MSKLDELRDVVRDSLGRMRTDSLFLEQSYSRPNATPIYSIKDYDNNGCRSLKKIYMALEDPTEYAVAMEVLGSWEHWEKLCNTAWFKPIVAKWRDELEIKMRSAAVMKIHNMSNDDSTTGFNASKYIAERGWDKTVVKSRRGRPNKEEVDRERKIAAGIMDELDDTLDRLNIN